MDIFLVTFNSVILLFGFGFIGFYIIARKIMPGEILKVLTPLVLDISLPFLVFSNIVKNFDPQTIPDWYKIPVWWLIAFFLTVAVILLYLKLSKNPTKSETAVSIVFPNALFFPLAILPGLYGKDTILLVYLFLFTLFFPLFLFNSFNYFFSKSSKKEKFRLKKLINSVFIATLLALVLCVTGFNKYIPEVFITISSKVGDISLPLIMIFIGGHIYLDIQNQGEIRFKPIISFLFLKHILLPGITLLFLILVNADPAISFLIFLQSILPPVTALSLMTERVNADTSITNQYLVSSFLVSLITIPLSLSIYNSIIGLPKF